MFNETKTIKVLHLCTYISDGAGRGAYWLHQGLKNAGIESQMLVTQRSEDSKILLSKCTKNQFWKNSRKLRRKLDNWTISSYPEKDSSSLYFSLLLDSEQYC